MPEQKVENPFKKGTKKFLVAERILAGEKDTKKIAEEIGVKPATVYSVSSILKKKGYIPGKTGKEKSILPSSENLPQQTEPEGPPVKTQQETSELENPPATSSQFVNQLADELAGKVLERLKRILPANLEPGGASDSKGASDGKSSGLPEGVELIGEAVDVEAEKVNYKIALNPEIFHRYNVFKAESARRGRKWEGTFSDWLDMVTRDILKVYGIYPAVVTTKGGKLILELPVESMEED